MPGKIKVKILAGRNLPVMDRSSDTTDAYVEIKFANTTYKTDVCRKTLHPQWNSEWYRFEVDDAELQDEPLQIRLMDHDTYSANDAIGKVYLNLNPLLLPGLPLTVKNIWTLEATMNSSTGSQGGSVMTGWIPVYDTMHGIRGEVNIIVKVELFSDFNKFRQSSCGVQFYYSPNVPYGYHAQVIHGFVEELIVSDDPEYKWIDKIRTPRASNEARQTQFLKLSGEVQRKIGLKALDLGGNAVIGYVQNFDLEGESGIVARGIGTAVTLIKLQDTTNFQPDNQSFEDFNILSKFKNRIELSESDDSLPLLSRSPSRSPVVSHQSLIATHSTKIGNKFPRYDRTKKSVRPIVRLSEYGSNSMRRQMSLQHSPRTNLKKVSAMSTQSLSDNLICESSLKTMLALEDMRGERTSAFSRGLKNLKYLPKRMIQMKTKISDSFDDESDQDSIYSSTWSIGGSDSTRSSINDPIQSLRKKKFTHKKNEGGIAALLIRSVHANFPLDSVLEDRETPTPSPVNFINDFQDINDASLRKITDNEKDLNNDLKIKNKKFDFENKRIPMISSSESDTSTSDDDDDDDEPSESSTNYNILDDSLSGIDLSSLSSDKSFIKPQKNDEIIKQNISLDQENNIHSTILIDKVHQGTSSETDDLNLIKNIPICRDDSIPEGIILDYDSATDESFVPLISSLSSTSDNILNQSSSLKLKYLIKQNSFDVSDDPGFLITSTPTETTEEPKFPSTQTTNLINDNDHVELNISSSLIDLDSEIPNSSSSKLPVKEKKLEIISVLHKTILPLKIEIPSTENSTEQSIIKNNNFENLKNTDNLSLSAPSTVLCNKKIKKIFHSDSFDDKNLSIKKGKISKKVTRTETVIYKGPLKENNDKLKKIKSLTPSSPKIIIAPPSEKESQVSSIKSDCHLRVPIGDSKEVNIHSPSTFEDKETPEFSLPNKYSMEAQIMSERFKRKYRQHCMLDLIRTIDAKMMVHHMHNNRKDSKKKRHDKNHINLTPSPESINRIRHRRNSRSKSPEKQHHHSHHNHSHHNHQLPLSSSSSSPLPHTLTTNSNNFTINNNNNIDNFNRENNNFKENLNIDMAVYKSHSDSNLDDLRDKLLSTNITNNANNTDDMCVPCPLIIPRQQEEVSATPPTQVLPGSVGTKLPNSPGIKHAIPLHRRSSDSDLSITPKGNSLAGSDRSMGGHMRPSTAIVRTMNQDALEMLEYPFLTMQQYPPGFVLNLGGLVSARSVKLIERISNLEEPEGRDAWWKEIRMEVRSHARALGCNVVLGYTEEISICDDVCVLNASGTAAVINLLNTATNQDQENVVLKAAQQPPVPPPPSTTTTDSIDTEKDNNNKNQKITNETITINNNSKSEEIQISQNPNEHIKTKKINDCNGDSYVTIQNNCNLCHLPYNEASVPFRVDVSKCGICKRAKVPDVLFTTIELPDNLPITGRGVFIQSTICKVKRDLRGELNAKEISDCLPFLEYELHSLLLNKLKVKGMNGIFGLKIQVSIGERLIIGIAVGTAVFLTALPAPSVPKISSNNSWNNNEQIVDIQKLLIDTVKKNREDYKLITLSDIDNNIKQQSQQTTSDTDESDDELPDLDLGLGTKDACVLEVDDIEDLDRINLLIDDKSPDDFHVVNTQTIPGLEDLEIVRNLQMFTQISRAKIPMTQFASMPSKYFSRILQTIFFKLRRMVPCALCDLQFKIAIPEQDEIQLTVIGMALGLGEPQRKYKKSKIINNNNVPLNKDQYKKNDDDMIFTLDEDQVENFNVTKINSSNAYLQNSSLLTNYNQKTRPKSPSKYKNHSMHHHKHVPLKERYGVDITPLSYLPSGRIERYLGNLNFFFIRESTSIRENGGLSGFTHSFLMEVLAIVRAHVTALGGNAMVSFFMTQCVLLHSPHKNQVFKFII
ncbi:uncharacterized protein LOC122853535 [Aphidius gifuensis]|uniref:uncharacterized protein LOC122853535 n=1 Tax=Aphidius gifuensis TaxID=684658 RepID=UPI001CDCF223|nr:uncharacterized protein LOC122853535 [Aphidius gifuensis]